jgi:hypothetical protein
MVDLPAPDGPMTTITIGEVERRIVDQHSWELQSDAGDGPSPRVTSPARAPARDAKW